MKCDICNEREATVFLTQMFNNEIRKLHLCEKCAMASGLDLGNAMSVTDALLGGDVKKKSKQQSVSKAASKRCPVCKMSYEDFKKISRFGCAMCYETFSDEIENMLESMHRGVRHIGKKPSSQHHAKIRVGQKDSLEELKFRLQKAIDVEDYEKAASLRDLIRELSKTKEANDIQLNGEKDVQ